MAGFVVGAFLVVAMVCVFGAMREESLGRVVRESVIAGIIGGVFGVALEDLIQAPVPASQAVAESASPAMITRRPPRGVASDKHKGLRATIQRCEGRGTVVRCDVVMTNATLFKRRFMFRIWDRDVRLWDQRGNLYRPIYLQVSNYRREFGGVRADVVRGVQTGTVMAFHVVPETPEFRVVELVIGVESNGQATFEFKHIPIQWLPAGSASPAPRR